MLFRSGLQRSNFSCEFPRFVVLHSVKGGAPQSATWRVHVNAVYLREAFMLLQQRSRQRAELAADSNDEEPLFSHVTQITDAMCRRNATVTSGQLGRNSCARKISERDVGSSARLVSRSMSVTASVGSLTTPSHRR